MVEVPIQPRMGAVLILLDERGKKYAVSNDALMSRISKLGTVEQAKLQSNVGRKVSVGGRHFLVLSASSRDLRDTMARGPQILTPKDLGAILYEADIVPGARVVEAGTGSGALTVAIARAVGPSGRVFSLDVNADALAIARGNVAHAGLLDRVQFLQADVRKGIETKEVDSVILDLVDPWAGVESAWEALRSCGHLATFSPNMEQVKETAAAIRHRSFVEMRTIELIEREMEVRDAGVRPSFAALGHTGYLTFARKVLDTF